MRIFLVLLLVAFGAWWHFRTPAGAPKPAVAAATPAAAPSRVVAAATPAPAAAPATGSSYPRRQIDRAQAAVNAAREQRDGF